jgi:hypothetical protein
MIWEIPPIPCRHCRFTPPRSAIGGPGEFADRDGIPGFLAAPASDYITGRAIFADGGLTARQGRLAVFGKEAA